MKCFELGRMVCTRGIAEKMDENSEFASFVNKSLAKYSKRDWGNTCDDDKKANDEAIKNGERILAVYSSDKLKTKIWIITEWDRSVTTILFPSEY